MLMVLVVVDVDGGAGDATVDQEMTSLPVIAISNGCITLFYRRTHLHNS